MSEEDHRQDVKKHKLHTGDDRGCLVRCSPHYAKSNPCSYRAQAEQRAKAENRIQYGKLKFKQNAHHIIPMSVLWRVLDEIAGLATPREGTMLDLVITGMLEEKYNINNKTNMIVLPTQRKVANRLGLPQHCKGRMPDHPDYSANVEVCLNAVPPKFQGLASDVRKKGHKSKKKPPKVKTVLEETSEATYEAIIMIGSTLADGSENLDSLADDIAGLALGILGR